MMSLWDALRMNMMISYQELVRTFPNSCSLADERRWDQFINSVNYWFGNIEYLYLVILILYCRYFNDCRIKFIVAL